VHIAELERRRREQVYETVNQNKEQNTC